MDQGENRSGVSCPQPSQQLQSPPAAALCGMWGASALHCFVTSCQYLLELNIMPAMWSRSSTPPGTAAMLLKALITVSLLKPTEIYTAGHHQPPSGPLALWTPPDIWPLSTRAKPELHTLPHPIASPSLLFHSCFCKVSIITISTMQTFL